MTKVLIWNEFRDEKEKPEAAKYYPKGIHVTLAQALTESKLEVRCATLDEPEHGLTEEALSWADTVVYWSHRAHLEVADAAVDRLHARVLEGLGLVVLHSAHFSKIFKRLMGTSCDLRWREAGEKERVWTLKPGHPIATNIPEQFDLPSEEMYGEHFDIPDPDELVFASWFAGGEVFRSGCCYRRGLGRIFYFRPGHEDYPTYHNVHVQRVIANAARWSARRPTPQPTRGNVPPLERLP